MKRKIFITGICGFVGSNLANKLYALGYDVTGCDNLQFGLAENVRGEVDFLAVSFSEISTEFLNEADVLVHCATSNLPYSQSFPVETFNNNALESVKLFERFKGKIIYTSTCSVYNNAAILPTPEDAPIHVVNAYDTSKYIAELFLKQRGNYTTLRLSNVYGINQRPENPYSGVLGKFIQSALKKESLKIYGSGDDTRDYTFVDDTVNAIIKAVELPALNTEINVATGIEMSVRKLCTLVCIAVNKVVQYERVEPRGIDGISRRCLNISMAEKLLHWKPTVPLEEGIKKTVEWQRSLLISFE